VTSVVKGDIPGLPKGTSEYLEHYDFANKRRRLDFKSQGYSKVRAVGEGTSRWAADANAQPKQKQKQKQKR
jgi:hypothetical protein